MVYYSLPENLSFLRKAFPGWGALMTKANETVLTSKDIWRLLEISYRQLNDWEKRGMLRSIFARPMSERTEGWRKFSILDVLCLGLLKEAKRLGIPITRLQNLMDEIFSAGGLLYDAIPYIVYGYDVYVHSNLNNSISLTALDREDEALQVRREDLKEGEIVVIIPLNKLVEDILTRLNLPDFQAIKKMEGGYNFIINGVPLALEQLPDQEQREPLSEVSG